MASTYSMKTDANPEQSSEGALVIIPARGGSKGLPGKNIKPLGGIPLIGWVIRAALGASSVGRVVVSTDSEEIAAVALEYGADVPFLRSGELANDTARLGPVIDHAINFLEERGEQVDICITLYPTSPFIRSELIDFLVGKCSDGHTPVHTNKRVDLNKRHIMFKNETGTFQRLCPEEHGSKMTYLRGYGLCTVTKMNTQPNPYCHVIESLAETMDIDTMDDFLLAEEMVKQGLDAFYE